MLAIILVGALVFVLAHPERDIGQHLADNDAADRAHPRPAAN